MSNLFWLAVEQLEAIEQAIPKNRRAAKPRRNREVISGIIHVMTVGCRWKDCPKEYGPYTAIYIRFNRWSKDGTWAKILEALVVHDAVDIQCFDSTAAKAHRCAAGGKGGPRRRPSARAGAGERPKSMPSSTQTAGPSPSS